MNILSQKIHKQQQKYDLVLILENNYKDCFPDSIKLLIPADMCL